MSSVDGTARAPALGWMLAALLACGCHRHVPSGTEEPAPSSSAITLSVGLATCDDAPACQGECDAGNADACRRLAASYSFGRGAPIDETRAASLYGRACDLEDPSACVFAGQMHEYARGVPKDDARAAGDYERSCDLGWPAGCYNLAIMVENGRGVERDRARAGKLYQVACTAGAEHACEKAKEMHEPPPATQ